MDFLISKNDRSLSDFYKNTIIYLSFYGLGSVKELLSMKMTDLIAFKRCLKDEDVKKLYYGMRGLSIDD